MPLVPISRVETGQSASDCFTGVVKARIESTNPLYGPKRSTKCMYARRNGSKFKNDWSSGTFIDVAECNRLCGAGVEMSDPRNKLEVREKSHTS